MHTGMLDPERGYLNKWEMYRALEGRNIGDCLMPFTALWHPQTLPNLLGRFHQLYMKPLGSWGGQGICVLSASDQVVRWSPQGGTSRTFPSVRALTAHLASIYAPGSAIVQQAAPLLHCKGRVFDIRVLMQRDLDDAWITAGMLCRVAGSDAVVSNVAVSQGSVRPLASTLRQALPKRLKSARNIQRIRDALDASGHQICTHIAPYRHFLEVGIDYGVDELGRLWLIEVNTDDALGGPSHELFAQLPDQKTYRQIQQRARDYHLQTLRWIFESAAMDGPSIG